MSKLDKDKLIGVYPSVLDNDKLFNALGRTMADKLGLAYLNVDFAKIYNRIDDLEEGVLDILAQDFNVSWYDYNATVEEKRAIIKNSMNARRHTGTKASVESIISDVMPGSKVEEWFEYNGDPYHFRMKIPGTWTPEKAEWITKAISLVKNVRSTVDDYTFVLEWLHHLYVGCALYTCGRTTYNVPAVVIEDDWYIDEDSDMLLDENGILLIVE